MSRSWRNHYDYDMDSFSLASALVCEDESLTVQSQKEEADINVLVERFGITGTMPQNLKHVVSSEFVETMDYRSALDALRAADAAFMELPANIREGFGNDAGKFVDFCSDPANIDDMREMGLAVPLPEVKSEESKSAG